MAAREVFVGIDVVKVRNAVAETGPDEEVQYLGEFDGKTGRIRVLSNVLDNRRWPRECRRHTAAA